MEFPQSGERIVGATARRAVYRTLPGRPSVTRIVVGGDLAVVEAKVDYGDATDWRAVFIYELRDGRIVRAAAYWAQPFEATGWRAEWVERMEGWAAARRARMKSQGHGPPGRSRSMSS